MAAAMPETRFGDAAKQKLAGHVRDGTVAYHVSVTAVKNLPKQIRDRLKSNLQAIDKVHVISLMTGSGMDEPACDAAERSWKDTGLLDERAGQKLFVPWVKCEKDQKKRDHLFRCFGTGCCMYDDVSSFASWSSATAKPKCCTHGHIGLEHLLEDPEVKAVIVVSGFSCKDFSKLNNFAKQKGISLKDLLDKGSSSTTLASTLRIIDLFSDLVLFVILENVDNMDGGHDKKNSLSVVEHLATYGVVAMRLLANCSDYGLPQRRVRLYFAGYNQDHPMVSETTRDDFEETVVRVMETSMMSAPDLRECLLPPEDAFVKHCLGYLQHLDKTRTDEQKEQILWPGLHMEVVARSHLRWGGLKKHRSTMTSKFYKCFPQRMKEVINFAEENPDFPKKAELCCDPSQNMHRFALGEMHNDESLITGTIIPNGWPWVGFANRCTSGGEQLAFQGFPIKQHQKALLVMEEPEIRDLSGNAFPCTVVGSLINGMFAGVQLVPPEPHFLSGRSLFMQSLRAASPGSSDDA